MWRRKYMRKFESRKRRFFIHFSSLRYNNHIFHSSHYLSNVTVSEYMDINYRWSPHSSLSLDVLAREWTGVFFIYSTHLKEYFSLFTSSWEKPHRHCRHQQSHYLSSFFRQCVPRIKNLFSSSPQVILQ